jgi:hypothetical protein
VGLRECDGDGKAAMVADRKGPDTEKS